MNKYRAYDKLEKQMRRVVSLHWQNDTLVAVKVEGEAEPLPIEGRFIVEQYTGLRDKNSVEIAVGDIVTIKHDDWDIQELRRVKYYGQFGYPAFDFSPSFDDVENGLSIVTQSDFYSVEVIGNIHENAELLEKTK